MTRCRRWTTGLVASILTLAALPGNAGDWPQFRGVARDGRAEPAPATGEHPALKLVWSYPAGPGYAGVSVADGIAVTLFTDGDHESVLALDAEVGTHRWSQAIGPATRSHNGKPSAPPASTPLIDRGVVYVLGAHGRLMALRHADGEILWSRKVDGHKPVHGFTASPLLAWMGQAIVVATGGRNGKSVTAFDRRDGAILWSQGSERVGYQSPALVTVDGRKILLAPSNDVVRGLDPATGATLFNYRHDGDDGDGFSIPVTVPAEGILLNHRHGATLYRASSRRKRLKLDMVWHTTALAGTYSAPVVHGGHLYGFAGDSLNCIDFEDGSVVWSEPLPGGRGLIVVGDHLVLFPPDGALVLADATPQGYRERTRLAVRAVDGYTWPSYANGRIFIRDHQRVSAVSLEPRFRIEP